MGKYVCKLSELLLVQFIRLIRENHPSISESRGDLSSLSDLWTSHGRCLIWKAVSRFVYRTLPNILPEHNQPCTILSHIFLKVAGVVYGPIFIIFDNNSG